MEILEVHKIKVMQLILVNGNCSKLTASGSKGSKQNWGCIFFTAPIDYSNPIPLEESVLKKHLM